MRLCVFTASGHDLALPVRSVVELFPADELTPVPTAPELVAGVVYRRGSVLPVLFLPPPLGRPWAAAAGQDLLRIAAAGAEVVTPIDRVHKLVHASQSALAPSPDAPLWVRGLLEVDGRPVQVLDPKTLIEAWQREVREHAEGAEEASP